MKRLVILIIVLIATMQACSEGFVSDLQEGDIRIEDFEKTWNVVNAQYPYLDYKKIDWDSIYQIYYPKIINSYSDEYLLEINQLLLKLRDGHVSLTLKNGRTLGYITPRQIKDKNSYDYTVTKEYIDIHENSMETDKIQYGLISEIGYFRIQSFLGYEIIDNLEKVFYDLRNTRALIIDVRHNGGGNTNNASYIVSKCIQEPLETPGWTEKGEFSQGPIIQPDSINNYSKQIVVLVNGKSFSATEHFALWMKNIDHVTLIGDTTGGGSGNPKTYLLASGNSIKVSTRFFYRYDGQPIEWNGIVPDILIEQKESDVLEGIDKQLEYAIEYLDLQSEQNMK